MGIDVQVDKKKFKSEKDIKMKINQAIKSALVKVNAKYKK